MGRTSRHSVSIPSNVAHHGPWPIFPAVHALFQQQAIPLYLSPSTAPMKAQRVGPFFPISVPVTVYHEGRYVVIYSGSIRTRLLHNVTSQSYIGVKTLSPPPLLQCMEPNAGLW